ncbi:MAG TPA: 50S ribosomal protein L9 [Thermomicrobiales bacterium]|nr:50S ribosomal protein L9 [Thermomicrobiales bacterium]
MKIVLRQDVENLGEKGSVKNVADGYARNYLIPRGMAVVATPGELKVVATNEAVKQRKITRQETELQGLADRINGQKLEFEARAGSNGRLFGSITNGDIAEKLSKAVDTEIDRRKIVIDEPIRTVGDHAVTVNLVGKLRPQVTVVVNGIVDEEEVDAATIELVDDEQNELAAES